MAPPVNLPPEVADTLVQFEGRFLTGMATMPATWLDQSVIDTAILGPAALKARFPIPVQAAKFVASQGPVAYRKLSQRFAEVDYDYWTDAVAELVDVLRSNEYTGWGQIPAAWARAIMTLKQLRAMLALEGGLTFENWDTQAGTPVYFFDELHPWNCVKPVAGQVNNNTMYSVSPSNTNFDAIADRFRTFKGPNGEDMGVRLTGFWYPGALATAFENLIRPSSTAITTASDGTDPGRWRGRVWGRETMESSEATTYYALGTTRPDIIPLLGCSKRAPAAVNMSTGRVTEGDEVETLISDMSSELYRTTHQVGIQKTVRYQARTGHHLSIIRCSTAAKP